MMLERTLAHSLALIAILFSAHCGGSSGDASGEGSARLAGSTVCEKGASLAKQVGCSFKGPCASWVPDACSEVTIGWFECIARDTSQCLCESDDGDLNCEGSWKPDEGPAKCIAENAAVEACLARFPKN